MKNIKILFFVLFGVLLLNQLGAQIAFPGAEGYGSKTNGGRDGMVVFVTNLNDSGIGSFRMACEANERRIIIFRTAGIIELKGDIVISNPFITVAGQTAPGDGICISGGTIVIATHDVIIRGLRIRVGDKSNSNPENLDAIAIANNKEEPYNIIIDHCSFSWAIDENVQLWYPCRDITIQWCIISESLHKSLHPKGAHGTAIIIGNHAKKISVHHNLLAHNNGRNPLVKQGTETEIVNNVIYNWGTWEATAINNHENQDYPIKTNIIGNYYKLGPDSSKRMPITFSSPMNFRKGTMFYLKNNYFEGKLLNNDDICQEDQYIGTFYTSKSTLPNSGINISSACMAYRDVLKYAGAIAPKRDAIDNRIVNDVRFGTGKIINSLKDIGGLLPYLSSELPEDSDNDGIPDYWECKHGLNANDPTDALSKSLCSERCFTNIEVYINNFY